MWIKQMLGFLLMVQLALLPFQSVSAGLFDMADSMHDIHQMERVLSVDNMASMDCMQEHDMSSGHCSDHSCPSCQCASCLLIPVLSIAVNSHSVSRSFQILLQPLSPSLDGLYRPPRA